MTVIPGASLGIHAPAPGRAPLPLQYAKLSQVGRIGLEQHLCGFGIAQNSSERLVEFMSDR